MSCLSTVKYNCFTNTSPPKEDILYHEHQLLANEPVLTKELRELQEQKALEQQYRQITSKLPSDQQALLQMHTGIDPMDPLANEYMYNSGHIGNKSYSSYSNSNRLGNPYGSSYPGSGSYLNNIDYNNPMNSHSRSGLYNRNHGYDSIHDQNPYYSGSKHGYGGTSDLTGTQLMADGSIKKTGQYGRSGNVYPSGPPSFLQQGLEGDTTFRGNSSSSPPVKRFLLTKDPKDRRNAGNGVGMKVLGGKEIPGSKGRVCGFVSKILPSGIADKLREVHEGDMVLEWNGVSLMDRTDSEVQHILDQSAFKQEVEILIRNDINMISGKRMPDFSGKLPDFGSFRDEDWYSAGTYEPYFREFPPRNKRYNQSNYQIDINGNRYNNSSGIDYQYRGRNNTYNQYGGSNFDQTGYGYDNAYLSSSKHDYRNQKYADDPRQLSRYKNHGDSFWRDTFSDRRRKRDYDRNYQGERELPNIPGFGRRHSWDAYDEMGNRDHHWRSKSSYGHRDSDYYNRGSNLRTRHHSDPAFRTDYNHSERRWHSQDRYPEEYKNRYLPEIRKAPKHYSDDPRERKYGSAQYLDYSSRKYREEFEDARKDLDRFQRYGSFKDYGNNYRYGNKQRSSSSDYRSRYHDDPYYNNYSDKWYDTKDRYTQGSHYNDFRGNSDRYREDERYRSHPRERTDYYDSRSRSGQHHDSRYNDHAFDDRYKDSVYDHRGKSRVVDDRYYDPNYSHQSGTLDNYGDNYTSTQYKDDRSYYNSGNRDSRYHGDYETSERDRRHRSRNPPQQLNLDGRTAMASPSMGRRDDTRNRDRKGKSTSKDKSRKSKRHHPPRAEVQLLICHDIVAQILYVTVLRARHLLTLREDGDTRPDPFIKVYLLPGRSLENQRRTRHFIRTSSPEWNQTMVYPNLQASDLRKRYLEVTAWNYDQSRPNEFLGEVVLDLSDPSVVDEDPKWYQLQEMVDRSDKPVNVLGTNTRLG